MKKRLKIPNEIKTIINKIKTSVNIVSISESSGVSTIITDTVQVFNNLSIVMLLKSGMVVTINNKNYVVSNIVDTPGVKSFDVHGTNIDVTSWHVAANFKTGTRVEINEVLNLQNNNEFREMKFPFVCCLFLFALEQCLRERSIHTQPEEHVLRYDRPDADRASM